MKKTQKTKTETKLENDSFEIETQQSWEILLKIPSPMELLPPQLSLEIISHKCIFELNY